MSDKIYNLLCSYSTFKVIIKNFLRHTILITDYGLNSYGMFYIIACKSIGKLMKLAVNDSRSEPGSYPR